MKMMKRIMKTAWSVAKNAAVQHGGNSKQYFSESLKMAWATYKNAIAKRDEKGSDIIGITAAWIKNKFGASSIVTINANSRLEILKENEESYYIKQTQLNQIKFGVYTEFWVPKSVCV